MGTLTSWTTGTNLLRSINSCDIVEFNRITYSHYGFYIGNGICVHVQAPDGKSLGSSSRSSSSSTSSGRSKKDCGTKVAERLIDIAGRDVVRVNNSELTAFQLGVNRRPEYEAKQLAISGLPVDCNGDVRLGERINVTYFLASSSNCEGWSNYWRYNHPYGWSIQAANGLVHSTIGTVERFSDKIICSAESVLTNKDATLYTKGAVAACVAPYVAAKYSVNCVKQVIDFASGGMMRLFK